MLPGAAKYWVPSSPGDIADRWTILNLKVLRADTEAKRHIAIRRLQELVLPEYDDATTAIVDALAKINERLWDLEDEIRRLLAAGSTKLDRFVEVARSIPLLNDTRAHLKGRIDEMMGHTDPQDVKVYCCTNDPPSPAPTAATPPV